MRALGAISVTVVGLVLVGSATARLSRPGDSIQSLGYGLGLPPAMARGVTLGSGVVEAASGAAILVVYALKESGWLGVFSGVSLVLFASYVIYTAFLVKHRPGAPCGCDSSGSAATVWTVVRAAILALFALVGVLSVHVGDLWHPSSMTDLVMFGLIVIGTALATWFLPIGTSRPWEVLAR